MIYTQDEQDIINFEISVYIFQITTVPIHTYYRHSHKKQRHTYHLINIDLGFFTLRVKRQVGTTLYTKYVGLW